MSNFGGEWKKGICLESGIGGAIVTKVLRKYDGNHTLL